MIKITPSAPKSDNRTQVKKRKALDSVSNSGKDFKTQLESLIGIQPDSSIEDLMDALKEREKRFLDIQSFYEMNLYKTAVQHILKKILDESAEVRTIERARHRNGNTKVVEVVEIIDQKLFELASLVTKEKPAFALMKTMEEIRGLILDLLH